MYYNGKFINISNLMCLKNYFFIKKQILYTYIQYCIDVISKNFTNKKEKKL